MTLMPTVQHTVEHITALLERLAPIHLAEDWDNVGLLVGNPASEVRRIMTCLTITPTSLAEALDRGADLIVTHHPLPFRPLRRLTTDTTEGRLLLDLIAGRVAVYSAHTAFDSAASGINQRLATGLALRDVSPLVAAEEITAVDNTTAEQDAALGTGRWGHVDPAVTLSEMADRVKTLLAVDLVRVVGDVDQPIKCVATACGSGGTLLDAARRAGCDCLVTGETNFHTCLEAEATGVALILPGHFASERFAVEALAQQLASDLEGVDVWASQHERDPIHTL